MHGQKLWTRNFILISLTNFLTHIAFYLLMATVAMHVIYEYDASQGVAGLTTGIFVVAALAARLFTGILIERAGKKRTLVAGTLLFFLSMVAYYFARSIGMIIVLRIIQGAAHGIITNTAASAVVDFIPVRRRGEGIGYYSTFMNIAMAVGPFLGIWMIQNSSFELIIFVCSMIAFIDLLTMLWLTVPDTDRPVQKNIGAQFRLNNLIEPASVPISVVMFFLTLAYSSLLSFLSLYGEEINLEKTARYFFLVYALALIITRPFTGKLFDTRGENAITYPLLVILGIGFILLSQSSGPVSFLTAAALIGISYGTLQSSFQTIAVKVAKNRTAQATTTFWVAIDSGSGFGPYIIGTIIGLMSYRTMYLTVGIWIFICIVFYYLAHGRQAAYMKSEN